MTVAPKIQDAKTRVSKVYAYKDLPLDVIRTWHAFRNENPVLYSPYFHPDYTKIIASLRDDVSVAVLKQNNAIVAILPFQGKSFARPVGSPMTDYQAVICKKGSSYTPEEVLEGTFVGAYHYNALLSNSDARADTLEKAAVIEFPDGPKSWRKNRNRAFKKHYSDLKRRIKNVTEDIGTPRFETCLQSEEVFKTLMDWKTAQFAASEYYNIFQNDWTRELLKTLLERDNTEALSLHMHALYFEDKLVAIDTGLVEGGTYHRWIVAYNPDYHKYSPGMQILNHIIDEADHLGYKRIDHGLGLEGFKKHYATKDVVAVSGFAAMSGLPSASSKAYNMLERMTSKHSSDVLGKLRRRYTQISGCEEGFANKQRVLLSSILQKAKSSAC